MADNKDKDLTLSELRELNRKMQIQLDYTQELRNIRKSKSPDMYQQRDQRLHKDPINSLTPKYHDARFLGGLGDLITKGITKGLNKIGINTTRGAANAAGNAASRGTKSSGVMGYAGKALAANGVYQTGSQLIELSKNVGNFGGLAEGLYDMDQSMRDIALRTGMARDNFAEMKKDIGKSLFDLTRMGVNFADVRDMSLEIGYQTGRIGDINKRTLREMTEIMKGADLSSAETGEIVGHFNLMGRSAKATKNYIQSAVQESEVMGLNSAKIIGQVRDNLKESQKYTFKNGLKSLKDMAKYSQTMGISISDTFGLIEKTNTIEGAIDVMSRMEALGMGGNLDALTLTHMSNYSPEDLQKQISQSIARSVKTKRGKDGEYEVTQGSKMLLRELSQSVGIEMTSLLESVKKQARYGDVEKQLRGKGLSENELFKLNNHLERASNGGFLLGGKNVNSLESNEIKGYLSKIEKNSSATMDDRAMASQGMVRTSERYTNQMISTTSGYMENLERHLKDLQSYDGETSNMKNPLAKFLVSEGLAFSHNTQKNLGMLELIREELTSQTGSINNMSEGLQEVINRSTPEYIKNLKGPNGGEVDNWEKTKTFIDYHLNGLKEYFKGNPIQVEGSVPMGLKFDIFLDQNKLISSIGKEVEVQIKGRQIGMNA